MFTTWTCDLLTPCWCLRTPRWTGTSTAERRAGTTVVCCRWAMAHQRSCGTNERSGWVGFELTIPYLALPRGAQWRPISRLSIGISPWKQLVGVPNLRFGTTGPDGSAPTLQSVSNTSPYLRGYVDHYGDCRTGISHTKLQLSGSHGYVDGTVSNGIHVSCTNRGCRHLPST